MNVSGGITQVGLKVPLQCLAFSPVQSDGEEMENGCCAAENITRGPHVTEERSKYPGSADLMHGGEILLFILA